MIGLYYNFASELEGYPKILRAGLQSGIRELDQHIQKNGLTGVLVSQYDGMPQKEPAPASAPSSYRGPRAE